MSQTFRGRAVRSLTVISAYQVVTDNPARGTTTAAGSAQQYSLLLSKQDPLKSPRPAFCRDLTLFIQQCQLLGQCRLVNIMTRCHIGKELPNTYARGHRCLDYAFATEAVASSVQNAGYEPFNSHFPTDHRPYNN